MTDIIISIFQMKKLGMRKVKIMCPSPQLKDSTNELRMRQTDPKASALHRLKH